MLMQPPGEKYALPIRVLHWLMALLIIGLLAAGLIMTNLPRGDPSRALLYSLHKSFGVTVLMLAVLRLCIRLTSGAPSLPAIIPAWQRRLAHLWHWALYGFMFLMPVSGYVMSTSFGLSVKWFGITLPKLMGVDKSRGALAADIHAYAAYTLIVLLVLHISAVFTHYLREHVNLLRRMT